MRAVTITDAVGLDAITVIDRDAPQAGPGQVRVRVDAAAVNPADVFMWKTHAGGALTPPFTPGMDIAGTIESVGSDVDRLTPGDAVMGVVNPRAPEGGGQAELVVVPAASVVKTSPELSATQAATIPMNGLTALEGLRLLDLPGGSSLAVTGGAGLLASYVIALAKRQGLRVIADTKTEDRDLVASFGADDIVPRGDAFTAAVRELLPDGVDAVYDTAAITRAALPAIRDGGQIAVIRGWDDQGDPGREIEVRPVSVGAALQNTEWLTQLADHAANGALKLRVAATYPPEDAAAAYQQMDAGGLRGRAVITFSENTD